MKKTQMALWCASYLEGGLDLCPELRDRERREIGDQLLYWQPDGKGKARRRYLTASGQRAKSLDAAIRTWAALT